MKRIKRNLVIESFRENTSIHGICYLNTKERPVKLIWTLILLVSTLMIIFSTILLLQRYLNYDDYMITKKSELDKLEEIPNILVCSSQHLSMVDSAESLNIDLEDCKINIRSQVINCMSFKREIIFTFNGFCLFIDFQQLKQNESLLFKQYHLLTHVDEYKVNVYMKFKNPYDKSLQFQLKLNRSSINFQGNSQLILNDLNTVYHMVKYFDVVLQKDSYITSLKNIKCSDDDYDSCEFVCLQRLIKHALNCDFTFNPEEPTIDFSFCTTDKLIQIEEIVKNYTSVRDEFKICKKCLPKCESLKFNIKEVHRINDQFRDKKMGSVLNLYLKFHKNENTIILKFESAELLNFVNGLWSLFLGISILSIWEIIEFVYALISQWFSIKKSSSGSLFQNLKCFICNESYFHGLKFIFMNKYSKEFKIRWTIVALIATGIFCSVTFHAIKDYKLYLSDFKKELTVISFDDHYMNRKLTILACIPLEFVNKNITTIFEKLDRIADSLFTNDYRDINDVIINYNKNLVKENIAIRDIDSYRKVFRNSSIKLPTAYLNVKETTLEASEMFYDKQCAWFKTNFKTKNLVNSGLFVIFASFSNNKLSSFLLDSDSLHLTSSSKMERLNADMIPYFNVILKHKKLLPAPYKPSCVQKKGYKQYECYQECFNILLDKVFGCKVKFSGFDESPKDCQPWLLPLIQNYEKYVLKNSYYDQCSHCKEPCEYYYYDIENNFSKLSSSFFNFKLSDILERTEQFAITTFEETVIIVTSYISLLFGGSLLAIIQILYNILSSKKLIKRFERIEFNFLKKFKFLDLLSNLNTIHCVKYLSFKNKNDYKKLFWILVLTATLIFSISISVLEFRKYNNSIKVSQTRLLQNEKVNWPVVYLCRSVEEPLGYLIKIINTASDFYKKFFALRQLDYDKFINEETSVRKIFEKYKSLFSNKTYSKLFEYNWSKFILDVMNNNQTTIISTGMNWEVNKTSNHQFIDYNNSIKILQTGALYDEYEFGKTSFFIDYCEAVSIPYGVEVNPFINSNKNELNILFEKKFPFPENYYIYLNSYILSSGVKLGVGNGEFKRIKSMLKNYDYKYGCKNKEKCIFNTKMLREYSEYELFLCNNELKEAIYTVFNCTPFINTTTRVPECFLHFSMVISEIMLRFKKDLFKCETSTAVFPIQYEPVLSPLKNGNTKVLAGVDMNGVQIYELGFEEKYDLLQLLMNLSNLLNMIIGFSFITIFELIFILFNRYFSTKSMEISSIKSV